MNTSNSAEQLDPFAPDEELGDSKDAQETEKKRKGRMQGYFRISLILGIILWLVDFLILFLDWHSFAALSFFCVIYTVVMVWGYVNSRAMYLKEMSNYTEEFHNFEDLLLQELRPAGEFLLELLLRVAVVVIVVHRGVELALDVLGDRSVVVMDACAALLLVDKR